MTILHHPNPFTRTLCHPDPSTRLRVLVDLILSDTEWFLTRPLPSGLPQSTGSSLTLLVITLIFRWTIILIIIEILRMLCHQEHHHRQIMFWWKRRRKDPGQPSLMHRSLSWREDFRCKSTCQDPRDQIWLMLWSCPKHRSRFGSRIGGTRLRGSRFRLNYSHLLIIITFTTGIGPGYPPLKSLLVCFYNILLLPTWVCHPNYRTPPTHPSPSSSDFKFILNCILKEYLRQEFQCLFKNSSWQENTFLVFSCCDSSSSNSIFLWNTYTLFIFDIFVEFLWLIVDRMI